MRFVFIVLLVVISHISQSQTVSKSRKSDTISVIGVGDIMMGTIIPSRSYLPEDCSGLFKNVSSILKNADVTFGNFEGVFTDTQAGAKDCGESKNCYTFGMPSNYVNTLVNAGFDVMSVANNHSGDFGANGRKNTVKTFTNANLNFAGFDDYQSTTFVRNGVKFGFCAFSPSEGTCSLNDYDLLQKLVKVLKSQCDIVIVSVHAGAEGSKSQHVTRKKEMFLGDNRGNVYQFARKAIDAGADIIFGHGPHVSRAVDIYKNRFITYSMGNFCTWSRINIDGVSGIAPIFKVNVDKKGNFISVEVTSTYQTKGNPPKIDKDKKVLKKIQELTRQDIPELQISISEEGVIKKATLP